MKDKVELAEWRGWTPLDGKLEGWYLPPGLKETLSDIHHRMYATDLPDPANKDSDCMELIRFLQNDGWIVTVTFAFAVYNAYDVVEIESHPERLDYSSRWTGDDYKQGVVELALKIKRQE